MSIVSVGDFFSSSSVHICSTDKQSRTIHLGGSRNADRLVLYCKNYGQLPARVSWAKSAISESQLTESRISKAPENPSRLIIFPNDQGDFTSQRVEFKTGEDKTIWIGFIVRYEATSESVGEYGIMGKYVSSQVAYFEQTDEWFESR